MRWRRSAGPPRHRANPGLTSGLPRVVERLFAALGKSLAHGFDGFPRKRREVCYDHPRVVAVVHSLAIGSIGSQCEQLGGPRLYERINRPVS
jgi:hypothetical protein